MTYVGDSSFQRWTLEESEGLLYATCDLDSDCGYRGYSFASARDCGYLLPADLNPEALEVDLWDMLIYVQLTQLHQTLMSKGWDQGRGDAFGLQSTHRLNIQYRSIDEAVFRQHFEVKIETSFDWMSFVQSASGPAEFNDPGFNVEVSIEPAGKEEVEG